MTFTRRFILLGGVSMLAACASKFRSYSGPQVTRVLAFKGERTLHLLHNNVLLKSYSFDLGFAPEGHKRIEGDGKTPEGEYVIDRRNPESRFHLSIGISYPNEHDRAHAETLGLRPGGNIFIHGEPNAFQPTGPDWTWGCIAVTNREMEDIYAMVQDGTPISIYA